MGGNSFPPKLSRSVAITEHRRRKIDIIRYVVPDNTENIDFNDEAEMQVTLKQKLRNEFIHK